MVTYFLHDFIIFGPFFGATGRARPAERPGASEMLQHALLKDLKPEPRVLQKLSAKFKAACEGDEVVEVSSSNDDDDLPSRADDDDDIDDNDVAAAVDAAVADVKADAGKKAAKKSHC